VGTRGERGDRTKGGAGMIVRIAGAAGQRTAQVDAPEPLAAGERLRLGYQSGGHRYLLALSIDEHGEVTPLYPERGSSLTVPAAVPSATHFLPDSLELTGAGLERIIVVLSDQPLEMEAAQRAARAAYERAGGELSRLPKLGLPGITFDLCRQELETCQRECRPITPPVVTGTSSEVPRDGVEWNASTRVLNCSRSSLRVTVTEEAARALTRGGADAAMINLAPDSVLLVRGGTKAFPLLLEDWAMLHAQLTGQPDAKIDLHANAKTVDGDTVWNATYESAGTRFVARAREQSNCRWLTIERDGTERRAAAVSSW